MQQNFNTIQGWVATHEGGYVDHPKDPGGATNKGVTYRTYNAYRRRMGLQPRDVRNISDAEAIEIYRTQYWDKVMGDQLPSGLDYAVYDFAVNSGPSRAVKFLQRIVGVKDDGLLGNNTLAAIVDYGDDENLILDLCYARWNWMQRLSTWSTFGTGWTRRVMGEDTGFQHNDVGVIDRAVMLSRNYSKIPAPLIAAEGKALVEDEKATERVKQGLTLENITKVVGGGSVPTAIIAASQDEGPMQYALAGAVGVAAILAAVVVYKLILKGE